MPASPNWMEHLAIKVGGADIDTKLMGAIVDVVIDTTLYLPTMFSMRFHDDDLAIVTGGPFETGKPVEIKLSNETGQPVKIVSGEITAIEPDYTANQNATLTIRGYDQSHRLSRGTKTKVFVQMTDSDIVQQIGSAAGLQVNAQATPQVHEHVFQHNQTDLEFLHQRAGRIGYELFIEDKKLFFRKPRGERGEVSLEWGTSLRSFRPRLTLSGQVDQVMVKGWDPAQKQEIIGQATNSDAAPVTGFNGSGGTLAQQAFSSAKQMVVRQPVANQGEADALAQSLLDEFNAGSLEAQGVAVGNPELLAGKKVKLDKLGTRFNGTYRVTSAAHIYSQEGYEVHFKVEGARAKTMADLIEDSSVFNLDGDLWGGVVPAIVTNIQDPLDMNRVKLKFPWMDDALESQWARVIGIGAGDKRGIQWLPEINDEVLVAFEHGDFMRPYVIGGLWNGKDELPESTSSVVKNGKVVMRTMKTREGHTIRMVDDDSKQYIEIVDSKTNTSIKMDAIEQKVTITAATQKIEMSADSGVKIESSSKIDIQGSGPVTIKGATVAIN